MCLGNEERKFHLEKLTGPIFDLNQRLISEMVQLPKVEIKPVFLKEICKKDDELPVSWKLLSYSITEQKALFEIPQDVQGMDRDVASGMIEEYLDGTRETLINFISQIQMLSPTPDCLKNEIPELDQFFTEIKYLQDEIDLKTIFKGKDQKIFKKLKTYQRAFDKCQARLKKKAKPASTSRSKKP